MRFPLGGLSSIFLPRYQFRKLVFFFSGFGIMVRFDAANPLNLIFFVALHY
jgi:hypothetical protein